jgi:hypothetical protein
MPPIRKTGLTCSWDTGILPTMAATGPSEIESGFARLPPEAQLGLLERLVRLVRLTVARDKDSRQLELSAIAADPQIQRELSQINTEFLGAEADGLERR